MFDIYQILINVEDNPGTSRAALIREVGYWSDRVARAVDKAVTRGLIVLDNGYILSHKGRRYLDLVRGE